MDPMIILIVLLVLIALYYGLGRNLEVSSNMLTRELEDAQRTQKQRIVRNNAKMELNDTDWKKATANIAKIDDLDI